MVTARNKSRKKITRTGAESGGHCPKTEDSGGMLSTRQQNRVATFVSASDIRGRSESSMSRVQGSLNWPSQVVMKSDMHV